MALRIFFILVATALLDSCKKHDYRDDVTGTYAGAYTYFSAYDTTSASGTVTITVSVDPNSTDRIIFTEGNSPFNAKLFEDYNFANEMNCSPHGAFRNDSLIFAWGCLHSGSMTYKNYYLKKQ